MSYIIEMENIPEVSSESTWKNLKYDNMHRNKGLQI